MKLTKAEYAERLKAYRKQRGPNPANCLASAIGWNQKCEREFQEVLRSKGIEWDASEPASSSAPGSYRKFEERYQKTATDEV
jgi:hypothetical protein